MMIVKRKVRLTTTKNEDEKHIHKLNKNVVMPLKKVMIAYKI